MIGPIGTAEYERLTTRLGRERYLRRRPAGFGDDTDLSARIALAARADRELSSATGTMSGTNAGIAAMATNRAFAAGGHAGGDGARLPASRVRGIKF